MLKTQQNIDSLRDEVMNDISPYFSHIDDIAERNTLKIKATQLLFHIKI